VSLHDRRAGLWRVAHYSDPLEFAPHDRCSWGHRFDDVQRRHRTLYCATTQETALPCTLVYEGRLLDLTDAHERQEIETRHARLLADHGMAHLDMHEVTTRRRIVTQTIATDAYDNLDVAAIVFASSRDGHACIALFEDRAELDEAGPPFALTDPPPESLVKVAADWKLRLSSAASATR